jgi:hypothetical protein
VTVIIHGKVFQDKKYMEWSWAQAKS